MIIVKGILLEVCEDSLVLRIWNVVYILSMFHVFDRFSDLPGKFLPIVIRDFGYSC